ncbi:F-box only protein 15 isoform X3 [Dunckerocampus dactyliophorus]|uniref:F-box only protein 15 isoform X3 n=1 Tax=Dunckerocampus dactyliophorus TaxID=161453 RepID=UPI002406C1EC|nr:F-box only protein 15 isoform X3 [Dunckerocampus dactyliophorus]
MLAVKEKTSQGGNKLSRLSPQNFMERLPSEILNKILSYLDAGTLVCIGHVSKTFYQLASDEALWRNIYKRLLNKKSISMVGKMLETTTLEAQARSEGYWKLHYFKTRDAWARRKWKTHLGVISRHTGLPSRTVQMLRGITWELTVTDKSRNEAAYDLSWFQFFETSVVLCWNGNLWQDYHHISTLQLHGVRRVALDCPGLKAPGWRSLMEVIDMESATKSMQDYGQDHVIELKLLKPHIVMGLWKDQRSIAFVIFTLHFHCLLERSTQGSSVCPYMEPVAKAPFDDIDPDYGLHGYQLHIVLHSSQCELMSGSFLQLFCRRDQIRDGLVKLTAIDETSFSQHTSLSGDVALPWRCEALQGEVKGRCFMTLTLLDEFNKPFWCISSPVSMKYQERPCSLFYAAEQFVIHYQDLDGQVMMNIVQEGEERPRGERVNSGSGVQHDSASAMSSGTGHRGRLQHTSRKWP